MIDEIGQEYELEIEGESGAIDSDGQMRSKNNKCILGGILKGFKDTKADELSQVTKRSMLALQMGSSFSLKGSRLEKMYNGVKGAYNLLKKGEVVCNNLNSFDSLFENYDSYIQNDGLSKEQASNLFAIEIARFCLVPNKGWNSLSWV